MDIDHQIKSVLKSFPGLTINKEKMEFSGELFISKMDSYDVKIVIGQFPDKFPLVYEIGERIPPKIDRHIYPISGNCCLTTAAKEQILIKSKVKSLTSFISLIVIPFFQNNSFYELNKRYKEGEYSHGVPGIIEAYQDILKLKNKNQVADVLGNIIGKQLINSSSCYCGSELPLRECKGGIHKSAYNEFKLINDELISQDLYQRINPFIREVKLYQQMRGF